jgi:branched-chain amino acid transport system substrate-binding protein
VAVGSDGQAYGLGLANVMEAELKKRSLTVAVRKDFDPRTDAEIDAFLRSAKDNGATAVFFGGRDAGGGCLVRARMQNVFDSATPFLGGDAIATPVCLRDAGPMAAGMYAAISGLDAAHPSTGMATVTAFKGAYPDSFDRYTLPAIDATTILLTAISRAVKAAGGNLPSKEDVRAQVARTRDQRGVMGTISFDAQGDTSLKVFTIYRSAAAPEAWNWTAEVRL